MISDLNGLSVATERMNACGRITEKNISRDVLNMCNFPPYWKNNKFVAVGKNIKLGEKIKWKGEYRGREKISRLLVQKKSSINIIHTYNTILLVLPWYMRREKRT